MLRPPPFGPEERAKSDQGQVIVGRTKFVVSTVRDAVARLAEQVKMVAYTMSSGDVPIERAFSSTLQWYDHFIEDTRGHFGSALLESLKDFKTQVEREYAEWRSIGMADPAKAQRIQQRIRMAREHLSVAIQEELASALPKPAPVTVVLSYGSFEGKPAFVATIRNVSPKQIPNWTVQLEIPPALIKSPRQIGSYVEGMSNKHRALFRPSEAFVEQKPLWHDESYPFPIQYEIDDSIPGTRLFNVRGLAYVGGELMAEQIKSVDELSTYFAPAVVAQRRAIEGLLRRAQRPL